jgi:EAL domain-containing protein (putative c-di-GMP-specific phosphodiesterase class I)
VFDAVDRGTVKAAARIDETEVDPAAEEIGGLVGMSVVAEGVEGAALYELGCDVAQGYHYARPMPPADLTAWPRTSAATALVR